MRCSAVLILFIFLQIHRGSFAKLDSKENQTEPEQQRSARVHRVADDFGDDSRTRASMKDIMIKQAIQLGGQELERLLVDFPNLSNLIQREAQLFKDLNLILKELIRDGTVTLRNIEAAIGEIADGSTARPFKNENGLRNLLSSIEELGNANESNGNWMLSPSRLESINELEMKTVKNAARTLDNVLMNIQNHVTFIRNIFDRLCRKHHTTLSSVSSDTEKPSMDQPKRVSML